MKTGRRKQVRKTTMVDGQVLPQEELAPGKAIPCGVGSDPQAEA
jgi:hypothetical protein